MAKEMKSRRSSTGQRKSLGARNGLIDNYQGILASMKESHEKTLKSIPKRDKQEIDSLNQAVLAGLSEIAMGVARNTALSETPSDDVSVKQNVFLQELKIKEESWKKLNQKETYLENIDWSSKVEISLENKAFIDKVSDIKIHEFLKTSSLNKACSTLSENFEVIRGINEVNAENTKIACANMHKLLFRDVHQMLAQSSLILNCSS